MSGDIYHGDCIEEMKTLPANHVDTIITDPPYGLSFMGKEWDKGVPGVPFWAEMLRVSKPGAMLLAFGGTRTFHRMTCAIEDAGWELRDCMMWLYGSGFPKSLDISKAIDKAKGERREVVGQTKSGGYKMQMKTNAAQGFRPDDYYPEGNNLTSKEAISDLAKQWSGWGTALKPAWEPIIVAMKPIEGTFADNAEKWGVAGLNVDGGRIGTETITTQGGQKFPKLYGTYAEATESTHKGRWPANLILDEEAGAMLDEQSGVSKSNASGYDFSKSGDDNPSHVVTNIKSGVHFGDSGGASRFFYCAKSSKSERNAGLEDFPDVDFSGGGGVNSEKADAYGARKHGQNIHPTVKPLKLMEYLCTLTKTPTGGVVLDPFAGSGTTGLACANTGRKYILIEREQKYIDIILARLEGK